MGSSGNSPATVFLGHSANAQGAGRIEPLAEHLRAVAERAAGFCEPFGCREQGYAAGLVHDLGKYAERFLRHVLGSRERAGDHWSAGAAWLVHVAKELGLLPAIAIAGHHAGLEQLYLAPDKLGRKIQADLKESPGSFTDPHFGQLVQRFQADGFALPAIRAGFTLSEAMACAQFDTRMLFSALVDADFLETEAHFQGDAQVPRRPRPAGPVLDVARAIEALNAHRESVRREHPGEPMGPVREQLFQACVDAAAGPQGLYTVSAPTGSGKTLALLGFALEHARLHGLRRIVLVMPFLNIIEQTAEIYRRIFSLERGFPESYVLEHHSLADRNQQTGGEADDDATPDWAKLLVENWDAPFILTTSVQLLESLMAARPARCRKLHRLARSVILFDEVQTLPLPLVKATLATLGRLAEPGGPYGSTVVFATATQPAFDVLHPCVAELSPVGWQPREVVAEPGPLYAPAASRVRVAWRHGTSIALSDLADELAREKRVLCIVNLKRHAVALARSLHERGVSGLRHLSTSMCPAHRQKVLEEVRERLDGGKRVRLVATQCVEAGVDLDFPVVYRALGPLEAIAQAAGRCNRHGSGPVGRVVVFKPLDDRGLYPPGYREAVDATESYLATLADEGNLDTLEILNAPGRLRNYFRHFYSLSGRATGMRDDEKTLLDEILGGNFAEVARLYRLIPQDSIQVLVPYLPKVFEELCAEIRGPRPSGADFLRAWCRRAALHGVSLYRPPRDSSLWNHLEPIAFSRRRDASAEESGWFQALPGIEYDKLLGLTEKTEEVWIA